MRFEYPRSGGLEPHQLLLRDVEGAREESSLDAEDGNFDPLTVITIKTY